MRPATVWIVRPGDHTGGRATLTLTSDSVIVDPDDGDRLEITAGRLTTVRRERGTPVLELRYLGDPGEERLLLLYFVEPPPLPERGRVPVLDTGGLERTVGALALRRANRRMKPVVREWAAAIVRLLER